MGDDSPRLCFFARSESHQDAEEEMLGLMAAKTNVGTMAAFNGTWWVRLGLPGSRALHVEESFVAIISQWCHHKPRRQHAPCNGLCSTPPGDCWTGLGKLGFDILERWSGWSGWSGVHLSSTGTAGHGLHASFFAHA